MPDPTPQDHERARRAVGECSAHAVTIDGCKVCAQLAAQVVQVAIALAEQRAELGDLFWAGLNAGDEAQAVWETVFGATFRSEVTTCAECSDPATCLGNYDDDGDYAMCDGCCTHSQEGGHCAPIQKENSDA